MTEKILLLGNNALTAGIAQDLIDSDIDLILATPDHEADLSTHVKDLVRNNQASEILTQSRVTDCRGSLGNFTVQLTAGQQRHSLLVSKIVIAEDAEQQTDYSLHALHPAPSVMTLSEIERNSIPDTKIESVYGEAQTLAFLMGLKQETTPENTRRAIKLAQKCQAAGKQVYILTGNLKVGDQGLEKLYRHARELGIIFIKFSHSLPRLQMDDQDRIIIEFDDEIAGRPFRLSPDLTILDEVRQPTSYIQELIHLFELETDPSGFAQADNVHRSGVGTNRAGIMVAGPARNVISQREHLMDTAAVALRSSTSIESSDSESKAGAEIEVGACIRCLTCYRLCPYGAIQVNTRVQVLSRACEACGICAAECPREAIQLPAVNAFNIGTCMADQNGLSKGDKYTPTFLAFACSRSAIPASRLAGCLSPTLPAGLKIIEIPCAGSLSLDHLLTGFRHGADGILVLTCHTDNCHASQGNQRALERVELMQNQLAKIGFEKERLQLITLASNMGTAFANIVTEFENNLRELGPSRLK